MEEPRGIMILRGFFMEKTKRLIGVLGIIMFLSGNAAAQNPFGLSNAIYEKLIQTTIVNEGNTYRLKKVIEKIKKGEDVYIAAIGGSVTEGAGPAKFTDGYAFQFFRAVKEKYAPGEGKNVFFDGAGLSGTPSLLGAVRYEKDVVKVLNHTPDLLIVEFAVNDGGEPVFQRSFEALIRNALYQNEETAVIALYCAATYGNTSGPKKEVGDYYNIPQINMLPVVNECLEKGTFKKEEFYADYVHPTIDGHKFMTDCLLSVLAKAEKSKDEKPVLPEKPFIEPTLDNMIFINGDDENVKITEGGFNQIDKNTQTIKKTNSAEFSKNWHHQFNAKPNVEPFKMEIKCKSLVLVWKNQSAGAFEKFGKAQVMVDGLNVGIFDGGKAGGWNNCETNLIIDGKTTKKHIVEIKMLTKDEKLGFTILAMSYTK